MVDYESILNTNMISALGCTEPIAIALSAAKARELLGSDPERITVFCSGNIIKNTLSVIVPNTNGMSGIKAASAVGCFGGNAELGLEVLTSADESAIEQAQAFIAAERIEVRHVQDVDKIYVRTFMEADSHTAEATIAYSHTHFAQLSKDGECLFCDTPDHVIEQQGSEEKMNIHDILTYAASIDFSKEQALAALLEKQIVTNYAIAEEGLRHEYGAAVGRTVLDSYPDSCRTRIRAYTAAGSDARMAGSSKAVVINSGSGNQGMTVSLPLIVYAKDHGVERERLYRSLIISNLIAIYIKRQIGNLSAFCGVVSAAAAAGAGLAYLEGFSEEQIGAVVSNALLTSGGIFCDGAKASCAAKISISLETALTSIEMVRQERRFPTLDGLGAQDHDQTIRNVAKVARDGMQETDDEILAIMLNK